MNRKNQRLMSIFLVLTLVFSMVSSVSGVFADLSKSPVGTSQGSEDSSEPEATPVDPRDGIGIPIGEDDPVEILFPTQEPTIPSEPTEVVTETPAPPVDDAEIPDPTGVLTETPEPTEELTETPEPSETPSQAVPLVVSPHGTPATIDATVEVTGVPEGGTILGPGPVNISVSLPSIPVIGDGVDDYFVWGDSVSFVISTSFMFSPVPPDQELYFNEVKVGTVVFSNNAEGQAVATVVFNGEPYIYDPDLLGEGEPPFADVSAEFTVNLYYNGTHGEDGDGHSTVAILDKTYIIRLPGDITTYAVDKSVGEINLANGTITWTVVITGETDTVPPTPIDLAGFVFSDDLTDVGAYVADSFTVGGIATTPDFAGNVMSYTFPDPSTSPQTITFTTTIPNTFMANGGDITNNASLLDGEDELGTDGATAPIPAPSVVKTGVADDGFGDGGATYDPNDRTITWYVTIDPQGRILDDLAITDPLTGGLTWGSAVWQQWNPTTETWDTLSTPTWSAEPTGGVYEIGDVDYIGRLVIVSIVPDDPDGTVASKTFYNHATATWTGPGGTSGGGESGTPGVGIGYDAISKGGTQSDADKTLHQITWTVNVDLKGQSPTDFVYYDLFVHNKNTADSALTGAAGWPAGISIGSSGITRSNGQKYISHSNDSHLTVEVISLGGLAELVKVTNLQATGSNQIVVKSQVLDPDILAGNGSNNSVPNYASLFKGTTYKNSAGASVPFFNHVLGKELLKRAEVANDHEGTIDPNNRTTTASEGFHYGYREAIFRLNINAASLDFANVETNLTGGFGTVTITDTLPAGWEFVPFTGGANFLIYSANNTYVAATPALTPSTITGFTGVVGTSSATFIFTNLNQPYVILVKARPTDATFDGYLVGGTAITRTNGVSLTTANWPTGASASQNVSLNPKIIEKSIDAAQQMNGELTWKLDYFPYGRPLANSFQDVLPEGIDLRLDSGGAIIWEQGGVRNITVHELNPNANNSGGYVLGVELDMSVIQANTTYNSETRTLSFTFPDNTKGYRLSYVTDITGLPGTVTNHASLIGADGDGTETEESFTITEQHGSAMMSRSGFVALTKTNQTGGVLPGAEFTLYNTNPDGSKGTARAVRTATANGTIRVYGLPPGTYILSETNTPPGHVSLGHDYVIVVAANFTTTIDGQSMSLQNPIPVINYEIQEESSQLTISKTVAGNGGDPNKTFTFTITFEGASGTYPYFGEGGAANGTIQSGGTITLSHGQSVTIQGLPIGATYTVVEADYSADGYTTTYTGATGTILEQEIATAAFTNTRLVGSLTLSKTVAGNGGDTTKLFTFTITFDGATGTYPYVGAGGAADGTITSGGTVTLSHGQSITINDLPPNAIYTVVEADYSADGYVTTYTGETGTIVAEQTVVAAFTNTRNIGNLTLSKSVAGNGGDTTKLFSFTITFVGAPSTYPYTGAGGAADGTITSGDTITLSHGQSITINQLPVGSTYTVVEADYTADGYVTTYSGETGTIGTGTTQVAAFTNTRNIGSLSITKEVAGNGGDTTKLFTFTITFVGAPYTYPYVGTGGAADGIIQSGDTITLSHGQGITINDLPIGAIYTVVETDYASDGYVTEFFNQTGTIRTGETIVASFINTREIGTLSVSKTVIGNGGDPDKLFSFTITFVGAPYTYSYTGAGGAADGTIQSGDTILLSHGQSITINGLPIGATYTVVEADYSADGYSTVYTGETGTIGSNDAAVASFTNARYIGSLTLSKTVIGNGGDPNKLFSFTITFQGADDIYPYVGAGGAADGTMQSGDTITLSHGQSITINGLPPNATYVVVEADYSADGYVTTYTGETGTIIAEETVVAAFTNARYIGSLTLSKTVVGNGGDPNKLFSFTITFQGADDIYPYVGAGGAADGTIQSGDTITLSHGQSITINELPPNATYVVVEADYSADGYVTTYTGQTGTIIAEETVVAAFTNTRNIGSLTVTKTVIGNGGDPEKLFTFTIFLEDALYTYPYVGTGGAPDGTIQSGGTVTLRHGQSITINDLPAGAGYTVVEADYSADGYVTVYSGAVGTIATGETLVASFVNSRTLGDLTIKKTVTGENGDRNRFFTFVVEIGRPGEFTYTGSRSGLISNGGTIMLKHGEQVTIHGIEVGTSYRITEKEANKDGYRTTYTGEVGTIQEQGVTASFTNTKSDFPYTGDDNLATISKMGLMVSVPLAFVFSGLYGILTARKRKNQQ